MKTAAEWEHDIANITLKIHNEFPELSKYISEMPDSFSEKDNDELDTKHFKEYYNSLEELIFEYNKTHEAKNEKDKSEPSKLEGYPLYPPSEDIYNRAKEAEDINPEDISKTKTPNEKQGTSNEKNFEDDMSGDDLDVPGSELDDQQESVGSEDEENNYYSLGGDDHNDLDEDKA
jgi:hypothetical protein